MMNMIQLQEQLKDFSQQQLIQEMKMPSGNVPQYLVLSEMQRRKRMQAAAAGDQGRPQTTVAEDAVAAAGVPQGGIAQMARTMAPQTDMTQNTGVAAMAGGGAVRRMQPGGLAGISRDVDVYSPTMGSSDLLHRSSGLLYSEMSPEELNILASGGDPEASREIEARLGSAGGAQPLQTEVGRPTDDAGYQELLDAGLDQSFLDEQLAGSSDPSYVIDYLRAQIEGSAGLDRPEPIFPPSSAAAEIEAINATEEEPLPMTTGEILTVGENESLLPPAPEAPEDGAGGAGGPSAADRLAMQDRWLALARFGLGLMSSDQPTFGGAIGEAGMSALDYMQGMEQQRFQRDLAERTLEARSAGSSRPPISLDNYIGALQAQLDGAQERLTNLSLDPNAPRTAIAEAEQDVANARASLQQAIGAGGMTFGFGPATQTLTQTLIDARDSATS